MTCLACVERLSQGTEGHAGRGMREPLDASDLQLAALPLYRRRFNDLMVDAIVKQKVGSSIWSFSEKGQQSQSA